MAKRKIKIKPLPIVDATPEFLEKHGSELVPAIKGGNVGGKNIFTTVRRKSPIESIRSLDDHEKAAGARLYELFYRAGMNPLRANDPSKEFVDGQGASTMPDCVMDALTAYNNAIKVLLPMQMPAIREIVIQEVSLSTFSKSHKKDIRAVKENLKLSLQQLSLHFGFSQIKR